jgi:two-component system sensor histidine kinase HydH
LRDSRHATEAGSLGHEVLKLVQETDRMSADSTTDADRLRRNYTEIAQLAGGLAHEVRNPLSTIRMNLELLSEDVAADDDPRLRRMQTKLDRIRRECLHLEEILTAFLQFARAGELRLEPASLGALLTDFVEVYRPQAQARAIDVVPRIAADLPTVRFDALLLRQALRNLVLNAEQSMPQGGLIELAAAATPAGVAITIIDSGCGIPAAAQGKIFDTFYSTKPGGSGLGLPTVRKIVEAHGGSIACESEPGKGTRFTLLLPTGAEVTSSDDRK